MTKRRFFRVLTKVHKWAGLILATQILLWFLSGFVMTIFPIDQVRGRHMASKAPMAFEAAPQINLTMLSRNYGPDLEKAELRSIAGTPVYYLIGADGDQIVDARDGAKYVITEPEIRKLAEHYYDGAGTVEALNKLDEAPLDYRGETPVWQAVFEDKQKTRLYLDATTGDLISVRTRLWRVFDTMWAMHIMDYTERDRTSSWWLRLFASAGLLFTLTGLGLLLSSFGLVNVKPRSGTGE